MCIKGRAAPWEIIRENQRRPVRAKAFCVNAFALTIIFADEKKEEKNSFILYTFVKFALVTEQKLNIEEYSISSVNPVPFQA